MCLLVFGVLIPYRTLSRRRPLVAFVMEGVALITGGASGVSRIPINRTRLTGRQIGAACAHAFVRKGVKNIILADYQRAPLESFEVELRMMYPDVQVLGVHCDVTDEGAVENMMAQAVARFGGVDYAVNSAGITNKSKVGEYRTEDVGLAPNDASLPTGSRQ
jgi:NAD(P)-dependent dehydrogenase (short-subunit alcohol dehydrogenase family)